MSGRKTESAFDVLLSGGVASTSTPVYRDNCADVQLALADVAAAPETTSWFVFLTGSGLALDPARTATFHAAALARSAGACVVVDLDYRPDPWPSAEAYGENVRMLLRGADLAIGTEEEVIVGCANFMPRLDEVERFIAACDSSLIGG